MSRQKTVIDPDTGKFQKTPIGELCDTLFKAGIRDEIYKAYRTHLKLMLKHIGRQPDSVKVNSDRVYQQVVEIRWMLPLAVLTVTLEEELPF